MKDFGIKTVSARLKAEVNFVYVNQETNEIDERSCEKPYSYLTFDLTKECPDKHCFRGNLFGKYVNIYQPLK